MDTTKVDDLQHIHQNVFGRIKFRDFTNVLKPKTKILGDIRLVFDISFEIMIHLKVHLV